LKLIDNIPVKRISQPSDIVAAADYFLSDQAGYVTG
jgi:NAD(P)-dependent dehydrogenase (short-subunit alcohol dehydrogenase family)